MHDPPQEQPGALTEDVREDHDEHSAPHPATAHSMPHVVPRFEDPPASHSHEKRAHSSPRLEQIKAILPQLLQLSLELHRRARHVASPEGLHIGALNAEMAAASAPDLHTALLRDVQTESAVSLVSLHLARNI